MMTWVICPDFQTSKMYIYIYMHPFYLLNPNKDRPTDQGQGRFSFPERLEPIRSLRSLTPCLGGSTWTRAREPCSAGGRLRTVRSLENKASDWVWAVWGCRFFMFFCGWKMPLPYFCEMFCSCFGKSLVRFIGSAVYWLVSISSLHSLRNPFGRLETPPRHVCFNFSKKSYLYLFGGELCSISLLNHCEIP